MRTNFGVYLFKNGNEENSSDSRVEFALNSVILVSYFAENTENPIKFLLIKLITETSDNLLISCL